MLKQINVKHINWQEVADGTGISRGQTAKVRYGRFKKQIESQILGDAIQVKKEKELEKDQDEGEEKGLVKGIGGSPLKRGQGGDAADEEEDERVDLAKRVKRDYDWASSIVSINSDDDSDDEESTNSSLPRTPLVKSEIDYNDGLPRFPIIKREPFYDALALRRASESRSRDKSAFDREGTIVSSPANMTQSSIFETPPRRQSSAYRSPWMMSGSEGNQEVPSTCPGRLELRDNSDGAGKGSAQKPFAID